MPIPSSAFEQFQTFVREAKSVVLSTHVNPDGDALGSQLALADLLQARGAAARIVNHDAIPAPYRFLDPGQSLIESYAPATHDDLFRTASHILVVDANQTSRLGNVEASVIASSASKIIVDHHPHPGSFAALTMIDTDATSTGEIVYKILKHLGSVPVSQPVANALYTAIMTDTGSFRFPKTDAETHRIIAELIEAGADPVGTYQHVYEGGPANRLQLLGEVLAGLRLAHESRVCALSVTREMFRRTGTSEIDTDAFVPMTLTVAGVQMGLMFTELDDCIKINVRSKGDVAANELARDFGGGGHRNAAGARVTDTTIEEVRVRVIERSKNYVK